MKTPMMACAALLAAFSAHAAAVGSPADVTLFDRSDGRQLPVYWHEGRAYVVGRPGNEYSVRIRNRQRDDVLGVISVDGVNVITGPGFRPRSARVNWQGMEAGDEQLMLAYREGDAGAFEALYRRHKGGLYRFVLRSIRDRATAEELYQELVGEIQRKGVPVKTGRFKAMMDVALINNGPVTLLIDSKKVF